VDAVLDTIVETVVVFAPRHGPGLIGGTVRRIHVERNRLDVQAQAVAGADARSRWEELDLQLHDLVGRRERGVVGGPVGVPRAVH
jgi:hypothetical protein